MDRFYDELVGLIYDIPIEPEGWRKFCRRLNEILDVSDVHIQAIDLTRQAVSFSQCESIIPMQELVSLEVNYLHQPVALDPRWSVFLDPHRKGWYQCHHHIDDAFVEKSPLYQNILLPAKIRYTASRELIWDDQLCVFIGVNTSFERQPLNQVELEFLDKLFVHLKRVAKIQRKLFYFSEQSIVGYALIDKLAQPVLLLELTGKISHLNHAMRELVHKSDAIVIQDNQLTFCDPYHDIFLDSLRQIEILFRTHQLALEHKEQCGCLKIISQSGEILYVFTSLIGAEHQSRAFGMRPQVMLTFYAPKYTAKVDLKLLHSAFGLTLAECKVALLLLEGHLPKKIAQENQVNVDTIRKQLQSIYRKTATNRQADLVKLLLNIPFYHVD